MVPAMTITDAQLADLREQFARIDAHITELEHRLAALIDMVESDDDAAPEPELALELGDDAEVPF